MTAPTLDDELLPEVEQQTITATEKADLARFDDQRRYYLLRPIVPVILILSGIAFPFGIFSDISSGSFISSLENGIVFFGCLISFIALRRRQINVASLALFLAVTILLYLLIGVDAWFSGPLRLSTVPEFAMLLFPIILAGVIGGPRLIAAITVITPLFTFLTLSVTAHQADLATALSSNTGLGLYIDPIATQIATGLLVLFTTNGLRRTQRELNTTRIAYRRERELDRLKTQFISNVNHELRTPLMSMRGYLVLARELGKRKDPDQQEYMLTRGVETVNHMEGIVESILAVRRIEATTASLELAPVHVRSAAISAIHLLDHSMTGDRERDVLIEIDDALWVQADQENLVQVMLNLLSNACKYSPAGASVEVSARLQSGSEPALVEVSVHDHGLGIPPDQIPLLFGRFVRLERDIASPVPGTGLGLAICRAYIEAMGGKIWVESQGIPGDGSTFRFTLAQAQPVLATVESAATVADVR
jgi:signal transduction histidine kinase